MAVQKKRSTRSKRGLRRSHDYLKIPNLFKNKITGKISLYHHLSEDGYYRGKKILQKKYNIKNK